MISQHTFSFDLPIWKIQYNISESTEDQKYLAIETRNKNQVNWSVIDIEANKTIWQKTPVETDWWTTLSGFDDKYLILDCYSGTNEPVASQKIYLDKTTGQVIEKLTPNQNQLKAHWQNPIAYQQSDNYYDTISQFIEKIVGQKCQNTIFYGEIDKNIILVYYICAHGSSALSPFLLVVSSQKVVLLHKPIEAGSNGTLHESCIYSQSQLIYLSSSNALSTVRFF